MTSTRNLLRAIGSAAGVAVSTAIEYGVMKSHLPSELPLSLRTQVISGTWLADSTNYPQWTSIILDAKMEGIHVVFITFVPLMGLCLIGCVMIQDRILTGDAKPKTEKEVVTNTSTLEPMAETEVSDDLESGRTSTPERSPNKDR